MAEYAVWAAIDEAPDGSIDNCMMDWYANRDEAFRAACAVSSDGSHVYMSEVQDNTFGDSFTEFNPDNVQNSYGVNLNYYSACKHMDAEVFDKVEKMRNVCTNQGVFDAYCKEHRKKFGAPWLFDRSDLGDLKENCYEKCACI